MSSKFIIILLLLSIFHQNMAYSMGEMSAFDSSLLEENYNAFIGDMNFPISDFMENIEISEITNKAKRGIDANHFVTGISYVELKVPSEIAGRQILSVDLERMDNKLNKSILGGRGCSLFIHSYASGEVDFKIMIEISVPKKIFSNIIYDKDQRISKAQSDILLKKCMRTTLRNASFNLKVSLPIRLGLNLKNEKLEEKFWAKNEMENSKKNGAKALANP